MACAAVSRLQLASVVVTDWLTIPIVLTVVGIPTTGKFREQTTLYSSLSLSLCYTRVAQNLKIKKNCQSLSHHHFHHEHHEHIPENNFGGATIIITGEIILRNSPHARK